MSREERRQYARQMKSMERGPSLPPAARARAERNAARRAARQANAEPKGSFSTRFWVRTIVIAVAAGFFGLSVQWSEGMPRALYVGLIVGAVVFALLLGFRFLQRRAVSRT
jgi:Flp pilus assembly protein TadB